MKADKQYKSSKKIKERISEIHEFAVQNHAKQPELVIELLKEAIELCRQINDIPMLLQSMYRCAYGLRIQLRLEDSLSMLHSALEIGLENGLRKETGIVYNNIANYHYALGNYGKAKEYFLKHCEIYAEIGDFQGNAESLATVALMCINEGKLSEGFSYCQVGFALCEEKKIPIPFHLLYNTATIYSNIGEIQKSLEYYFATLEIAEKNNYVTIQAATHAAISKIYMENGDTDAALEHSSLALACHDKFVNPGEKCVILAMMADNLMALERLDEAEFYLQQGWEIVDGKNLLPKELQLLKGESALSIKKGNHQKALESLKRALAVAELLSSDKEKVDVLLKMSRLTNSDERAEFIRQSLSIAVKIGYRAKFPEIYFALYEYFESGGEIEEAFKNYKLFHAVKQEIHGETTIRRMQVAQLHQDAAKARNEAREMRLKSEMLEHEAKLRASQMNDLTADVIQKNQVLSQIKQNSMEALRQHGLKQKKTLHAIIKIAEDGATSFWQQLEERTNGVEGNFNEKMLKICPELTPVELRILLLLKTGISNKEISQILFIAERTIEYHRTTIRKKLQLGRSGNLITYLQSLSV